MPSILNKQQKVYLYAILSVAVILLVWFLVVPPSYVSLDKEEGTREDGIFDMLRSEFSNIF